MSDHDRGVGAGSGEGTAQPGGDREAADAPLPNDEATETHAVAPSAASRVGEREPGDTDDIGSTDQMTASTGGLAGTSR